MEYTNYDTSSDTITFNNLFGTEKYETSVGVDTIQQSSNEITKDKQGDPCFGSMYYNTIGDYMPWADRVKEGEDPRLYETRNYQSLPVIFIFIIIYVSIIATMFNKYIYTGMFWTVFTIELIWGLFAVLSIWYISIHHGALGGIILGIIFILLAIAFIAISIEQEHQDYINLPTEKYDSDNYK